jgi:hypothetical protein
VRRAGLIGLLTALAASAAAAAPDVTALQVQPSALDTAVKAFDEPSVVLSPAGASAQTPLVLFLSGTGGKPANTLPLLKVIAGQGYRVIGLEYDDEPAVAQVCPRDPDPGCSEAFRRMRIYGQAAASPVSNPVAESIEARLTALLRSLDRTRPSEGWGAYLKDNRPDWSRMVVSGLSQGAGMAALIAKDHEVLRVVLFSSPWDWTGPARAPAPWLSKPSATAPDRWFAEYHRRENTAPALRRAYAALQIPADHIRVFDHDIPDRFAAGTARSPNPYHGLTIRDPAYEADWRAMFGSGVK